jgi:hypothetical protein
VIAYNSLDPGLKQNYDLDFVLMSEESISVDRAIAAVISSHATNHYGNIEELNSISSIPFVPYPNPEIIPEECCLYIPEDNIPRLNKAIEATNKRVSMKQLLDAIKP